MMCLMINLILLAGWQMNQPMMSQMMGDPSVMMSWTAHAQPPAGIGPIQPAMSTLANNVATAIDMTNASRTPLQFPSCTLYPPPPSK